MLKPEFSGLQGQYFGYGCPGHLRRRAIISHDIDFVVLTREDFDELHYFNIEKW